MEPLTENKIILVTRLTRLDELISRFNTLDQAKFYIEHMGGDFSDYQREYKRYHQAVKNVEQVLNTLGRVQKVERSFLPNFIFSKKDIIVVIGQDGLVVNTAKYLDGQVIVAVNPDPERWDGVLLPFVDSDINKIIPEVFANKRKTKKITMAKAQLNNGLKLYAVNDLFIGHKSHTSARYQIKIATKEEQHSSSGIIVSTGLGSTGWLKSIMVGATAIVSELYTDTPTASKYTKTTWNADYLYYSVREPFPSKTSSALLVFGKITTTNPLILTSQMPENGVIFSDGIEKDFLEFNSGAVATIGIADKFANIVV